MSQDNVELAQSWFDRWNAGERTFRDEEMHPEVKLVSRGIMEGRHLRGREGVRRWLREIDEQFDEWRITGEDWRAVGDSVAVLGQLHLHGRRSGVTLDQPIGALLEIRGGQLFRMETFIDEPSAALEAAGLAE
jgi:ketosteroid isomerase-like protein